MVAWGGRPSDASGRVERLPPFSFGPPQRHNPKLSDAAMRLAWKEGRFTPSACLSINTPPEQANREANVLYPLPE